jgi:SPP1 gp7 family putative phage head morphogenesis protein
MTDKNDEIFEDILVRQLQSLRIDARFRKDVLKDLKRLEAEIVSKIRASGLEGQAVKTKRLQSLLNSVQKIIDRSYKNIDKSFKKAVTEFAKLEANRTDKVLKSVVGISTTALTAKQINNIYSEALIEGAPSSEWWLRQSEKTKRAFTDNMREGLLRGETNQQLVQRVRGTRSFNFTNGIMNTARRDSEALVRSSVQSVANMSRFETFEANQDIIKSYRHVSALDSRTSEVCVVRDGKRWKSETKEPIGHNLSFRVPPLHWNCRSTLIPEIEGVTLADDAVRASVDGPVKANVSFDDFLKSKPQAFQDELLGKGKAQLYRSGKITLRQLLDQSGNPLTLTELKTKYNLT